MAYKTKDALSAFRNYLDIDNHDIKFETIPDTKERGIVLTLNSEEKFVVFIYPIVHKQDDSKNYFDTRDSGPRERAITWNYSIRNKCKYFCLGLNDSVEKYRNYIFSLECNENIIQQLSGTENGDRSETSKGNQIIIPNGYIPSKDFDRITNSLGTYISIIHKDQLYNYLRFFDNRPYMLNISEINIDDLSGYDSSDKDLPAIQDPNLEKYASVDSRKRGGENVILYGVPGAGKSFKISHDYSSDSSCMERVVFHPDYTYSDFVGQILPKVEGDKVSYVFTPGPFTKIMKKAWKEYDKMFYLVIEEINRGNAPAIFGDIFQLLDRDENGWGQYHIYNADMSHEIFPDSKKDMPIQIPSNLSILATMNTSDQNVFTLDNAFQRRWKMRLIHNDFNANGQVKHDSHIRHLIKDSTVTWGSFAKLINSQIAKNSREMIGAEDKRLGVFFASDSELDSREDFAEKVIKYLWDDAFKMDRSSIFLDSFFTFEELIDAYISAQGDPLRAVFRDDIYNGMNLSMTDNG